MGSEDDINNDGDMGFHQQQQHPKVSTVSAMEMSSGSMFKSSNGSSHLFGPGWDPLVSLNHGGDFGASHASEFASTSAYPVGLENEGLLHHYHRSGSVLGEMAPKLGCFGSGSFSEMVNSFVGLPECGQITNITTQSQKDEGVSPNRREKRRTSHSSFKPNKSGDGEQQDDVSGDSSENIKDQNEKKQKMEHGINPNSWPKQMGKQAKENSDSGGAPKENYIHVRAKRGQATNSHSLAERVRREKISERMKLLQELVPGCNKITGKAVMLDEIINYVQSLQQQVEFLSMKLATVNPELNIDVDRILSKDNLHLRGSNSNHVLLGFIPGLSSSNPYPQGSMPTGIPTTAPFHPIHPQPVWDNNLHNLLQMGFDSNASTNNLGPNGHSKLEL